MAGANFALTDPDGFYASQLQFVVNLSMSF